MNQSLSNPLRIGLRQERVIPPQCLIIFGASGDLTHRKLIPALFELFLQRRIPSEFAIVGCARRPWNDEEFRAKMFIKLENQISKNEKEIPLWEMISMSYEQLEKRLQNLSDKIKLKHTIENDYSLMGGGTLPDKSISSPVLKINRLENEDLMNKFLENTIPIIPRINTDNIIIDLRSTSEKNDNVLLEFFESV